MAINIAGRGVCNASTINKPARARVRRLKELLRAFQFVPPAAKKPHGIVVCCTLYPLTHTHILALWARFCVWARAEVNLFRIIICLRGLSAVCWRDWQRAARGVNLAYLLWMLVGWLLDGGGSGGGRRRTHKRVIRIARLHHKCHQVGVYLPAHDPISAAFADSLSRIFAASPHCVGATARRRRRISRRTRPTQKQSRSVFHWLLHIQNIQWISALTFNLITYLFTVCSAFIFYPLTDKA